MTDIKPILLDPTIDGLYDYQRQIIAKMINNQGIPSYLFHPERNQSMTLIRSTGPNKGYVSFDPDTGELEIHLKPVPPHGNYFDIQAANTELRRELHEVKDCLAAYKQEARDKSAGLQHAEEEIERLKKHNENLTLALNGSEQLKASYALQTDRLIGKLNLALEENCDFRTSNGILRKKLDELRDQLQNITGHSPCPEPEDD